MPGQGTEADVDPCGIQVGIPKEFLKKNIGYDNPQDINCSWNVLYIYTIFPNRLKRLDGKYKPAYQHISTSLKAF